MTIGTQCENNFLKLSVRSVALFKYKVYNLFVTD